MLQTLSDIQSALIPQEKISRCAPDDTLDAAFGKTRSSHDAVFVWGSDKNFLGLASASYALFRKHYPFGTKVRSCLIHSPRVTLSTPLWEIAECMVSTGCYTLPVFHSSGSVIGAISAKNIWQGLAKDPGSFLDSIRNVKATKPVSAPMNCSVKDILELLRQEKTSRIVLVNEAGKLEAIIARRDVQQLMIKPAKRQSAMPSPGGARANAFGTETKSRLDTSAKTYAKRNILVVPEHTPLAEQVRTLLSSGKTSIVVVDGKDRPVGIISMRTLLQSLALAKPEVEIPVIVRNDAKLPSADIDYITSLLATFAKKLYKHSPLQRVEVSIKESKNPAGRPIVFELVLQVLLASGARFVAKTQNYKLKPALQEVILEVKQQEAKKHHS